MSTKITKKQLEEAADVLRQIMEAEGADPDSRYLLDDIVTDLGRILAGELKVVDGEVVFTEPVVDADAVIEAYHRGADKEELVEMVITEYEYGPARAVEVVDEIIGGLLNQVYGSLC